MRSTDAMPWVTGYFSETYSSDNSGLTTTASEIYYLALQLVKTRKKCATDSKHFYEPKKEYQLWHHYYRMSTQIQSSLLTPFLLLASRLPYDVVQTNSTTDGKYTAKFLSECEYELHLWVWWQILVFQDSLPRAFCHTCMYIPITTCMKAPIMSLLEEFKKRLQAHTARSPQSHTSTKKITGRKAEICVLSLALRIVGWVYPKS